MFEPAARPRLFHVPPGADFPRALVAGLLDRMAGQPPEALARVELLVNTRRMERRIAAILDEGTARLLPRIRLVTDLGSGALAGIPAAVPPLRRRLELTQLVARLLDQQPDLAPRTATFDLADSLARLLDEMQGEGVAPDALRKLDVTDSSGHWQRSLAFVNLVETYLSDTAGPRPDPEARQRRIIQATIEKWQATPPDHPVLIAGSTGSRGATALLMQAITRLPQGAVILPGFDTDMPGAVWSALDDPRTGEDHPQFRFARLLSALDTAPGDVRPWHDTPPPCPERNRLISLALRPAPVTDQWMSEGPALTGLDTATRELTLIEAPSQRDEATAIALILRQAAETGTTAALITPDRTLTRQVEAALDRWGIIADDSAGRPLALSAPGRFLRHVAALFGTPLTAEALLTLLKHPLAASGGADRGPHLRHTRELELRLRRFGPPYPDAAALAAWAAKGDADRQAWARWVAETLTGAETVGTRPLADHVAHHLDLAERLAAGPDATGSGALWLERAGEKARAETDALRREAGHGGDMPAAEYAALFDAILQRAEVRDSVTAHPGLMIWGTLEARVQGADLIVAAGLNEGVWPEAPAPDPWLNRQMRLQAGLLLPERRIGLSAHDFQQAIGAPRVVLSRAIRDAEAQTVPSRWLNRLVNLLGGISDDGKTALAAMRARGNDWLAMAAALDRADAAVPPAARPAPRPPVDARPKSLSITQVQTLIRDPFAIYARHVLGLKPLDPLRQSPDAPLRGTVIHRILERFVDEVPLADLPAARAALLSISDQVLAEQAPWPAARRLWRAKIARFADWFLTQEAGRRQTAAPLALEHTGRLDVPDLDFTLTGKIDRVDRAEDGTLTIYDYKTGSAPSVKQLRHYDKQLHLAALMAEAGAIEGVPAARVAAVAHIALGAKLSDTPVELDPAALVQVRDEFRALLSAYRQRAQGYPSRRAVDPQRGPGDYDHLARHGEWDDADPPWPVEVGE